MGKINTHACIGKFYINKKTRMLNKLMGEKDKGFHEYLRETGRNEKDFREFIFVNTVLTLGN